MADQLSPDDQATIREAIDERSAIMEFDGGLSRKVADAMAETAMRVYFAEVADSGAADAPVRRVTLLAPGLTLEQARQSCIGRFGAERVRDVRAYRGRV